MGSMTRLRGGDSVGTEEAAMVQGKEASNGKYDGQC